jgi:DNA-binding Lrp family transcriptional regulator
LIDKFDVELVRELFQGLPTSPIRPEIKLSFRAISRRLGLSEGAIRARARRLEESGFIRGYAVHPNPSLIDAEVHAITFDVRSQPKQSVVDELRLVEGVYVLVDYHGPFVGVVLLCPTPTESFLKRKIDLISRIAGTDRLWVSQIPFPPFPGQISLLDWKILLSLKEDLAKSYEQVSRELKISSRTVKRRMSLISRRGAAFLLPSTDEAALQGTLRADLCVKWVERGWERAQEKIMDIVKDYCFFNGLWVGYSAFHLFIPNVPTSLEIMSKVRRLQGIREARIEFVQRRYENYELLGEMIERKLNQVSVPLARSRGAR